MSEAAIHAAEAITRAFEEEHPHDADARGSERLPHRRIALTFDGSPEHQVRDVGRHDDERQHGHDAEDGQEARPHVGHRKERGRPNTPSAARGPSGVSAGYAARSCSQTAANSARACESVTPGRELADDGDERRARDWSSSPRLPIASVIRAERHPDVLAGHERRAEKSRRVTPTTVAGWPLTV